MSVTVVGLYNTCDSIGRTIPSYWVGPSIRSLRIMSILRLLLIVTTIFGLPAYGSGITLSSWYAFINFCIIGFTNGICGTYVMMKGTGAT